MLNYGEKKTNRSVRDKLHTLTATSCQVCGKLEDQGLPPAVVDQFYPQKSANDISKAPIHNWYFFTLGFSPNFVKYEIAKHKISSDDVVLDPFVGSGTTLVECKLSGIDSFGVDANDFLTFASRVKTNWDVDSSEVKRALQAMMAEVAPSVAEVVYEITPLTGGGSRTISKNYYSSTNVLIRPYYISQKPLMKLLIIKKRIEEIKERSEVKDLFRLALASIVLPSSNIRYGPGFGVTKPKEDVDVLRLFTDKVNRMKEDLEAVKKLDRIGHADVILGDTRNLRKATSGRMFDFVITSPPYPGDHEYTLQTRLELAFLGFAKSQDEVRVIKKRMLRGSTRNLYSTDNETEAISEFPEIVEMMRRIERRVKETNGTSGFERLYPKVVGEYFGGMYRCLYEIYESLDAGGNAAFLVSDSHAFKMVHIETARLLGLIGKKIGFEPSTELWWNKRSTAHKFFLPEYILNLRKR